MVIETAFFNMSRELYRLAEIERECLFLQDRYGLNVNVLLFCLWHGRQGRDVLVTAFFEEVMSALEQWHETVVLPIRRARRQIKTVDTPWIAPDERDEIRRGVLNAEIAAEVGEQKILIRVFDAKRHASASSTSADRRSVSQANLLAYAQARQLDDEPEVAASFRRLVTAAGAIAE